MHTWLCAVLIVATSVSALAVRVRAHLLAVYLWRKTGDLSVLREVARFERSTR